MTIRYSPYPREQYTVEIEGRLRGLGVHPSLINAPLGVWNIVWLSVPQVDLFLAPCKDVLELPHSVNTLPVAVGTAYQEYEPGKECWMLAEEVPPKDFLDTIQHCTYRYELLSSYFFGEEFWATAYERAELYRLAVEEQKIVQVNFGGIQ